MKKKFSTLPTAAKASAIGAWLEEHKAQNPVTLDLSAHNCFAECMIVVTASSVRHAQSLAEGVATFCKQEQFEFLRIEGKQTGQWILLDLNDLVIHIFQEPVRELYRLESLWNQRPRTTAHAQPLDPDQTAEQTTIHSPDATPS